MKLQDYHVETPNLFSTDYSMIGKLINIALATMRIREIRTPYNIKIRPQMHLLLYGSIGSGKSSIMYQVADQLNQQCYMNLTKATILGAVDKNTGIFSPPAIWDSRNSALLIDEFAIGKKDNTGRELLRTLLQLLEKPQYNKRIGYRCNDLEEKDDDLFCKVKENMISCKTRFILFANTMMNLQSTQMQELNALKSRCLTIPYYPSLDDIKNKLRGKMEYIYVKHRPKQKIRIPKDVYERFIALLDTKKIKAEYYMRTIGDMSRAYAVIGEDKEIINFICELARSK